MSYWIEPLCILKMEINIKKMPKITWTKLNFAKMSNIKLQQIRNDYYICIKIRPLATSPHKADKKIFQNCTVGQPLKIWKNHFKLYLFWA